MEYTGIIIRTGPIYFSGRLHEVLKAEFQYGARAAQAKTRTLLSQTIFSWNQNS